MTIKCPKCQHENPEDISFCGECGTKLILGDRPTQTMKIPADLKQSARIDIGQVVARRYKILEVLGRGGMGIVYKAEDLKLKRTVALKFLPPELCYDEEAKERFMIEAQAAAGLSHPNICTIHEINDDVDSMFISMEFVAGQSLREIIKENPLPIDKVIDISKQLAAGLEEAHKKGIVHRDIKSANIMVTSSGQVKIMDFGLAKVLGRTLITRQPSTMGTLAYMSPEQVKGETVDPRTDIWSFGVVLYEMLSGDLPFKGDNEALIPYAIEHHEPIPINRIVREIPMELQTVILNALEKNKAERTPSISEALDDLKALEVKLKEQEASGFGLRNLLTEIRKPKVAFFLALLILFLCFLTIRAFIRSAEIQHAKNTTIPELLNLIEEERYLAAYQLAKQVEQILPDNPLLNSVWTDVTRELKWKTEPPGAALYIKPKVQELDNWIEMGEITGKGNRIPLGDYLARIKKEGYEDFYLFIPSRPSRSEYLIKLISNDCENSGMVVIPGSISKIINCDLHSYEHPSTVVLDDFLIDKHEVTNKEYKEFVDNGGYEDSTFWKHEFLKDGKSLGFQEAIEKFHDQTGRLGPATWEFGTYTGGSGDYPVTGVSWYEAAAYAEFVGKRLPTIYHFDRAALLGIAGFVVPGSNFKDGLSPVGSHLGSVIFGTFDMAGNAREWTQSATGDKRFVAGGAWNDPEYYFTEPGIKDPFDRDPGNGFRCMKLLSPESTSDEIEKPLKRIPVTDWNKEEPFSDEEFNNWLWSIQYSNTELSARVEVIDDGSKFWEVEKVIFRAAYNQEEMLGYLFLPKQAVPPYQVIVYWPGAVALNISSSENGSLLYDKYMWDYFVKDGRAVFCPILKRTYDRGGLAPESFEQMLNLILDKDLIIKQIRDVLRSIDYLETREDIDASKIAYCGWSWGAHYGVFPCAIDNRIKAGILMAGCVYSRDVFGFAHRVKIPILMINGRYDNYFPYDLTQVPLYNAFATPDKHKHFEPLPTAHNMFSHRKEWIRLNLEWLDLYLGPVKRK